MNRFSKAQKDSTPSEFNNNVIYEIECNDCTASYVGQTKRQLKTRIQEHKNNFKLHHSKQSIITQHMVDKKDNMKWNNVLILDRETNYHKRLISETIYIKQQQNGLNTIEDIKLFDKANIFRYLNL